MILILLYSLIAIVVSQTQEQPLCSRLENVYESMCPSQVERSALLSRQGLPGKRGPIGSTGERGLKGSKGENGSAVEPNLAHVEEMMSQRIQEVLQTQSQKLSELSIALMEAKRDITQLANKPDYCPIKYNGKCFWLEPRFGSNINFGQGRDICQARGATPANIYSQSHYFMMLGYLRMFIGKDGEVWVWLGMTYNFQTNTANLYDGSRAPFVKWYRGHPARKTSGRRNIYLEARMDWQSTNQHMFIAPSPSWTRRGVFCEK